MERITLNMVPTGVLEICHASQYDIGREIRFDLIDGTDDFVLSGDEDITIFIRDFDGNLIESSAPNTSSNYVVWTSSEGELDVSGPAICELRVTKDDDVLGSANFIMEIEADAYDGAGVVVETVGPADICTFETNLPEPLQSVIVDVEATGGNGTPDNPNPINGYSSANITRCGVNLWGGDSLADAFVGARNYSKNTSNKTFDFSVWGVSPYFKIVYDKFKSNTQYTFIFRYTATAINNSLEIHYTDSTFDRITFETNSEKTDLVVTSASGKTIENVNLSYIKAGVVTVYYDESGLFEGVKTIDDFAPYNGQTYTVNFGQTVYGGQLDVTRGKLRGTKKDKLCNGSESWQGYTTSSDTITFALTNAVSDILNQNEQISNMFTYNANAWDASRNLPNTFVLGISKTLFVQVSIDDYPDTNSFKTFLSNNNLNVVYNCTPFDIDLTPEVISAIVGENNVFADCGETTVKYLKVGA